MTNLYRAGAGAALLLFLSPLAATADMSGVAVCEDQQGLEQVIGSNGDIMPDGCRRLTISVLEDGGERLCLLDFSSREEGFVDQLRDAAFSDRWWVRCDALGSAAE